MEREEKREEVETGNIIRSEEYDDIIVGSSDDDGDEFDFSFVPQFQEETGNDLADNIFANGQIRPVYPVFDRSLIPSEALNLDLMNISTDDDRMEKAEKESTPAPGSYCVWSPKLDAPPLDRKSRSTGGSSSKRWRLSDFVVGRSKSDGKHKFFWLVPSPKTDKEGEKDKGETKLTKGTMIVAEKTTMRKKKEKMTKESNMVAAHRLYYAKDGGASGSKPKSYLPYRKNLVGFQPF